VRPDGDTWGFSDAITRGVRGAAEVLTFAISFVIATAPLWLVGLVAFFIVRAIVRRRRRVREASASAADESADMSAGVGNTEA
jgi:flagellar biosynthesis/type III secretory pathway M-ring protein FliF/YscJ